MNGPARRAIARARDAGLERVAVVDWDVHHGNGTQEGFYERSDVLTYQTPPLEQDIAVAGPLQVELWVSSTATDTDFTAKLVDVYPPSDDFPSGYDMNISDALIRASYRDDQHTRDLIEPGHIYRFVIRPFSTANVFKRGHRIRVDISSSNFPRFDVNPNTGEPLGKNRRMVSANNTVHHSSTYPSHIVLPILPVMPDPMRDSSD